MDTAREAILAILGHYQELLWYGAVCSNEAEGLIVRGL